MNTVRANERPSLLIGAGESFLRRLASWTGQGLLLLVASASAMAILFLLFFIVRDALPFFRLQGITEFFTSVRWYPSAQQKPEFGALAIFYGSAMVTAGAVLFAAPLGVAAAVCLSDVLPFSLRQTVKPIIEILAAIPSVAYGFFSLVIFAPLLQSQGGPILAAGVWIVGGPLAVLAAVVASDLCIPATLSPKARTSLRVTLLSIFLAALAAGLYAIASKLYGVKIESGTNALNASLILGIMALPTVVSVSEDALSAIGRDMREGAYALGSTRAETLVKVVIPAASSGILAAVLLGVMRALGETMVVWMASGNAAAIPNPWYNVMRPVRTLTATIAGDMGEADHVTGSARFHVLFAMGLCLLIFSFFCNLASEWALRRQKARRG